MFNSFYSEGQVVLPRQNSDHQVNTLSAQSSNVEGAASRALMQRSSQKTKNAGQLQSYPQETRGA
jgi:hypothetical protein